MAFRTDPESYPCPSMSNVAVNGATLTINLDADMASSYRRVPTASEFDVHVDGVTVGLAADGLAASGNTITLTLAEPVTADQSVTVSYTPGDSPRRGGLHRRVCHQRHRAGRGPSGRGGRVGLGRRGARRPHGERQ